MENTQVFVGKCLNAKIFHIIVVGGFPGSGIVAQALEFGGSLLNEKASEKEMQDLRNHIASLGEGQEVLKKTLEEVLLRMENQRDEVRNDWDKIQEDMMIIFNDVKSSNREYAGVIKQIKDVALHARIMLEDLKYKVDDDVSRQI